MLLANGAVKESKPHWGSWTHPLLLSHVKLVYFPNAQEKDLAMCHK